MVAPEHASVDLEDILFRIERDGLKERLGSTVDSLLEKWREFTGKTHDGMLDVTRVINHEDVKELNVLLKEKGLQIIPAEGSAFDRKPKNTLVAPEYKLTSL